MELVTLEKIAPPHPMVEAIAGHVYMEAGDLDTAISRFAAALQRYPNKMQLVYDYPEALLKDKQPAKAASYLTEQLQRYPNDGPLHLQAAKAYGALGKQTLAHRHQAEYYAWLGNLKRGRPMEIASKAGDGDFYRRRSSTPGCHDATSAEQQANSDRNG